MFLWSKIGHWRFTRQDLIAAVFLLGIMNGITDTVFQSIAATGFKAALGGTFGISVLVLACAFLAISSIVQSGQDRFSTSDLTFCVVLIALLLIPSVHLSWVVTTLIGLREYRNSEAGTVRRRAAVLMLGVTMPMFWTRVIFALVSGWVLKGDAALVGLLTGTERIGNAVALADGSGYLWIASGCSSLANMSLAVLCWMMVTEYRGRSRNVHDYSTCFVACLAVIAVNVGRISLIGLRPDLYSWIHGPEGTSFTSYLTSLVTLVICFSGVWGESIAGDIRRRAHRVWADIHRPESCAPDA